MAVIYALDAAFKTSARVDNISLSEALQAVNFEGMTGTVSFKGNDRAGGYVDIMQFSTTDPASLVGYYNGTSTVYIETSRLEFINATVPVSSIHIFHILCFCYPFLEVIPDQVTYAASSGIAISMAIVTSVFVVLSLIVYIYLISHWNSEVIRRSSVMFLTLFEASMLLCSASLISWGLTQNRYICIAKIILGILGYSVWLGYFYL